MNIKRVLTSIIGVNILGLGMAILVNVEFALDSFDSLAYFIQKILKMDTLGNAIFILHVLFWIVYLCINKMEWKNTENLISIISVFLITRIINIYIHSISFDISSSLESLLLFALGFLIVNLGLYLIAVTDLFIPPYDKLIVHIAEARDMKIGTIRQITDMSIITFLFSVSLFSPELVLISLGTLVFGFGTGFNIGIYERMFNNIYENL